MTFDWKKKQKRQKIVNLELEPFSLYGAKCQNMRSERRMMRLLNA